MPAEQSPELELEHAIGYSGNLSNSIYLHPQIKNKFIYPTGASVVLSDLSDEHDQKFFWGHDSNVSCIAYSKSGNLVATGQYGFNSDVLVWDVFKNELVYHFSEHDVGVRALAFSDDERLLCSVGAEKDEKLIFYDLYTGYMIAMCSAANQPVDSLIFGGKVKDVKGRDTPNYLLVSAGNRSLEIWSIDPFTGELVHNKVNPAGIIRDYTALDFSKDSKFLYAGSKTGDVVVINIKHCSLYTTLGKIKSGVSMVKALSNGLMIGGGMGELYFYELIPETRAEQAQFIERSQALGIKGSISGIGVDEPNQIFVGTNSGFFYQVQYPKQLGVMYHSESHSSIVKGLSYDITCSDILATVSYDRSVRIWNLNNYHTQTSIFNSELGNPESLAFTVDCTYTAWADGYITSHNSDNGEMLWTLKNCHVNGCSVIRLSHNRRFLVSGGKEGEIRLWELRSREMMTHLKEHTMEITEIELFKDDIHCLSSSRDRNILCWDLKAERRVGNLTQKMGSINSISIGSDETTILSVGSDKAINFWDLRVPNPVNSILLKDEGLCIDSGLGNYFVTGGTGNIIRLYDIRTQKVGRGHSSTIMGIQYSPDNKQITSVGGDGIFLWNIL